jgi:drug/metabolite transporter (DMT)-like permease
MNSFFTKEISGVIIRSYLRLEGALDMAYVGFLALGVFVGCVAVLGFKQAENDFAKGGTAILAAALGGVAIAFSDKLAAVVKAPESIFMYPIGLLVAVPWFYMPEVLKLGDDSSKKGLVRLMYLAIAGTVLVTILAAGLAFIPPFRALLNN